MTPSHRYETSQLIENQAELGSHGRVLKNRLHITRKREMDIIEAELYALVQPKLMGMFTKDHRFTSTDICTLHRAWLGEVYEWGGDYRQVNVSKGSFSFAMARHIPQLMIDFDRGPLKEFTPCLFETDTEITTALAVVHTELMLIHPFREGNGRVGRLLAVLMALQAGLRGLDFSGIIGKKRKEYYAAVQSGLAHDYEPMKQVFTSVLLRTRRRRGQS
ncbi:MAG: cell filamentation protein Fic [Nitrospirae bacterium]|nr:MAG: cell filamentation protein Fic [Nitrospirota bacterium]